jgi:large subunit ribosomal protein L22
MAVKSPQEVSRSAMTRMLEEVGEGEDERVVQTSSRRTKITADFVGHTIRVFDGRRYRPVRITEEMVGRTLGEVAGPRSIKARLKYVSIPPRKMRLVAGMVKGMPVERALNILNFSPRVAARHLAKTLTSAAANALSLAGTDALKAEDLRIKNITVDRAPAQKRIRFRSMGRVYRYNKRFSHLTVVLEEAAAVDRKKVARPTGKAAEGAEVDEEKAPKSGKTTRKKKADSGKKKVTRPEGRQKAKSDAKGKSRQAPKAAPKTRKSDTGSRAKSKSTRTHAEKKK